MTPAPTAHGKWIEHAACRDEDPELFVPSGDSTGVANHAHAVAKEICKRCPVATECLASALTAPFIVVGTWAGTNEDQRRKVLGKYRRGRR